VPELAGAEWQYVKECIDTNWVSSVGGFVDRFERELAAYVGTEYAVATTSGTAALHVALLVAGVQPEDEVIVSTLTFIASANAVRYCGAWPVLVDSEPSYWQMDVDRVAAFLENECDWKDGALHDKATGRRVKAILPVHVLGHPVDMDPLIALAHKYGLAVVEDATESLGAGYKGRKVGKLGDIACFSFNGNKLMTTGGGGMIVTDNPDWAKRARYLTTQAKDDPVEYVHNEIGYNYRLTNIQAAIGCAQLENIAHLLDAKVRIANLYAKCLADAPGITLMHQADWAESAWWMYTIRVDEVEAGISSRDLMRHLSDRKIQTRPLWQPMHLSKAHESARMTPCPVASQLYADALSLPCSAGLTPADQMRVIENLREALR
jgi:perosamine synthetase